MVIPPANSNNSTWPDPRGHLPGDLKVCDPRRYDTPPVVVDDNDDSADDIDNGDAGVGVDDDDYDDDDDDDEDDEVDPRQ